MTGVVSSQDRQRTEQAQSLQNACFCDKWYLSRTARLAFCAPCFPMGSGRELREQCLLTWYGTDSRFILSQVRTSTGLVIRTCVIAVPGSVLLRTLYGVSEYYYFRQLSVART
jgi:hypothetical protein